MTTINRRVALPVLISLVALSISFAAACGSGDEDRSFVTGRVTRVVPSSVTALAELELVDADGVVWQFEARGFVGFTPSHLEEHGATNSPVRVEYFEENGRLVISLVTDG